MKEIEIVIVNWNSGCQLRECLESIEAFGAGFIDRVTIVDNGSIDDSLTIDGGELFSIDIIQARENLGFAKACNRGATKGTSPYLLFLNPDARLMANSIGNALAFMESEKATRVGICGVQLIDERGVTQRHCARFPSWRTYLGLATGLNRILPSLFPSHFLRDFDHLTSRTVDQVIGAFFLVRRELFQALGGFDERFFVYFEELDFSLRAKQAGWSTWYLSDAVAFHKGGGVSEQVKAHRLFYSLRSRLLYAFKHFPCVQAWVVVGVTLVLEFVSRMARAALRGSSQEFRDTARGYGMLWANLSRVLRKGT